MFSGVQSLMNGKSEPSAICTARAVLPDATGPKNNKAKKSLRQEQITRKTTTKPKVRIKHTLKE
jgi:hypothetical protein